MSPINAKERNFRVITPRPSSGADGVYFSSMSGFEKMSQCFRFDLRVVSEDFEILADEFLGKSVTIEVGGLHDDPMDTKFFNGIVERFSYAENEGRLAAYDIVLRPNIWFLSNTTDNRIFQNLNAIDIVQKIFMEYGFENYKNLCSSKEEREYCVQYGESDLDFVQRLLEEEGVFYYFEYSQDKHTLMLCDDVGSLQSVPGFETIPFIPDAGQFLRDREGILNFNSAMAVVPGTFTHTDYDFEAPSKNLLTKMVGDRNTPFGDFEKYEYPGSFTKFSVGEKLAAIRNEADQSFEHDITAISNCRVPRVGSTFAMEDFPRDIENKDYFVLEAQYDMHAGQYFSGEQRDSEEGYTATFKLHPLKSAYRPPRVTPKSVMKGPQTAVVVGPSGEEIYTDKYSRVKVQFHWDREGSDNENSSCWIRVSSVWAGKGWGFIQIPRIGEEVIVDFLEGDPDRPIITGRVYNSVQEVPYMLPDNKTQSGWKSNSSRGGDGYNELMFEDLKGKELVRFQAEKDHDEVIKNNETRWIGNDWIEEIGRDATQVVHRDREETVDRDKTVLVKGNRTVNINMDDTETVDLNRSLTVHQNESITVDMNSTEMIKLMHAQTVGVNQTVTVGALRVDSVGAAEKRSVGGAQTNTIGAARSMTVADSQTHTIGSDDTWTIAKNQKEEIGETQDVTIGKDQSTKVAKNRDAKIGENDSATIAKDMTVEVGKNLVIKAGDSITFTCGKANIQMQKDGSISISGKNITSSDKGKTTIKASGEIVMKGSKISQN